MKTGTGAGVILRLLGIVSNGIFNHKNIRCPGAWQTQHYN